MTPQGVIFDLDDTLIDATSAYAEALQELGLASKGGIYEKSRTLVKERLPRGHVCSHNRVLYFKAMLEAKGEFSGQRVLDLVRTYESALYRIVALQWDRFERMKLMEGLRRNFVIGLLTNETTRMQMVKIAAIDPFGVLFSAVVTSEEMGSEKPDHRNFRNVAERMGVPLEHCCVVGDSWEKDIEPALALGCSAIWTQEFTRTKYDRKDVPVVQSLNEISKWLQVRKAS
ncbi:MAG: HAD family hydrolase [Deltaproteobacteria bacterium]|nr:HAD family hydrolase [Deltaproteobacteria bacterium]